MGTGHLSPGAVALFRDVLDGQLALSGAKAAELSWPGGRRIRLVREDDLPHGGALHRIRFSRAPGTYNSHDRERAGLLASHLGLTVDLTD